MKLCMQILLTLALSIINIAIANAHNPQTAAINLHPVEGIWVLQMNFSQEGAHYALSKHYTNIDLQQRSVQDYKQLFVDYIKAHCRIEIDGKVIPLASGGIKLGSHQTDLKFLLPNFPVEFEQAKIQLTIFEENDHQNTVLRIQDQDKYIRKVLNHENAFTLHFQNTVQGYHTNDPDPYLTAQMQYGVGLAMLLLFAIFWRRNIHQEQAIKTN